MNVSIRSQLVAGVVALGASAVVIAPIAQPDLAPAVKGMNAVQLAAWANPITAIGGVIADAGTDLFYQGYISDDVWWPDTFYGLYLYAPLNYGIFPDAANQFSTGVISGEINNLSGYTWAGVAGASALAGGLIDSAWNWPTSVITAVQALADGDSEAALAALVTGIVDPIKAGIDGLTGSFGYIIDNVMENLNTVFTSYLPYLSQGLIDSVVGGTQYVIQQIGATFAQIVQDFQDGGVEAAWNTAVEGFLGRNGTLGQMEKLSLGIGIVQEVEGDPTVVIPSVRSVWTSEEQRLGGDKLWEDGGITNAPYTPSVGSEPESAAAVEPAPAAALESAPVAASTSDAPAAAAAVEAPAAAVGEAPVAEVAPAPAVEVEAPAAPEAPVAADNAVSAPSADVATATAGDDGGAKQSHRAPRRGGRG